MNLYLDTCVLAIQGIARSGLLSPLVAIAGAENHEIFVPELVVTEWENLRRSQAQQSIVDLERAVKKANNHFRTGSLYIPSIEEVVAVADRPAGSSPLDQDPQHGQVGLSLFELPLVEQQP